MSRASKRRRERFKREAAQRKAAQPDGGAPPPDTSSPKPRTGIRFIDSTIDQVGTMFKTPGGLNFPVDMERTKMTRIGKMVDTSDDTATPKIPGIDDEDADEKQNDEKD